MQDPSIEAPAAVEVTRWLAVGSLFALIALCLAWELWLVPSRLAVKALPLCIPIGGLLRRRMYTYRWLSLLVWAYFAEGVMAATSGKPVVVPLGIAEIALALVLFAACAWHVRLRLKSSHATTA